MELEAALKTILQSAGISEDTTTVLQEEGVNTLTSLREEHFERLLTKLKVGQHAVLMKLWDRQSNWRRGK